MFTGIIEALGTVHSLQNGRLLLQTETQDWKEGESIAVSGCCLTLLTSDLPLLAFDLSEETLSRTHLGSLQPGMKVNLERAMRLSDRLGGHIVQGHVDGLATVVGIESQGESTVFRFQIASEQDRYLIDKGSITLDGISLTVVEPEQGEFSVWVVPHTFRETTLNDRKVGDRVNVEFDVLAKYLEKLTNKI